MHWQVCLPTEPMSTIEMPAANDLGCSFLCTGMTTQATHVAAPFSSPTKLPVNTFPVRHCPHNPPTTALLPQPAPSIPGMPSFSLGSLLAGAGAANWVEQMKRRETVRALVKGMDATSPKLSKVCGQLPCGELSTTNVRTAR